MLCRLFLCSGRNVFGLLFTGNRDKMKKIIDFWVIQC